MIWTKKLDTYYYLATLRQFSVKKYKFYPTYWLLIVLETYRSLKTEKNNRLSVSRHFLQKPVFQKQFKHRQTNQTHRMFYTTQKIQVNFICLLINSTRLTITPWKIFTSDLYVYMHINSVKLFCFIINKSKGMAFSFMRSLIILFTPLFIICPNKIYSEGKSWWPFYKTNIFWTCILQFVKNLESVSLKSLNMFQIYISRKNKN